MRFLVQGRRSWLVKNELTAAQASAADRTHGNFVERKVTP